ncbi:MAG: AbiV family abortive infection protein [Crocinitomicaceae bacterium]|nr:AbiV family abortive infection protein [Crocinitomicaceae bacterium]
MSFGNLMNLSSEELKKGAIFSLVNAHELFGDAMILKCLRTSPRAYSLIQLSLEETAKSLILFELSVHKRFVNVSPELKGTYAQRIRLANKILKLHEEKSTYAIEFVVVKLKEFIDSHPADLPEDSHIRKSLVDLKNKIDDVPKLNERKNSSLYVSLEGNKFVHPNATISKDELHALDNFVYPLLKEAKNSILTKDDDYYQSLGLDPKKLYDMDPYHQSQRAHAFNVMEWNNEDKLRQP